MKSSVKPIPAGYHTVMPYLIVKGAVKALDFYKRAFGASEVMRLADPGGKIAHAEIKIGDSHVALSDEFPEWGNLSPQSIGGSGVLLHVYVDDVDTFASRAVAAGAKILVPVKDQFYGNRSGRLIDPFGHLWIVATHKEDASEEEIRRRFDAFQKQQGKF